MATLDLLQPSMMVATAAASFLGSALLGSTGFGPAILFHVFIAVAEMITHQIAPPALVITFITMPMCLTLIVATVVTWNDIHKAMYCMMVVPAGAMIPIGTLLLLELNPAPVRRIVGGIVLVFAFAQFGREVRTYEYRKWRASLLPSSPRSTPYRKFHRPRHASFDQPRCSPGRAGVPDGACAQQVTPRSRLFKHSTRRARYGSDAGVTAAASDLGPADGLHPSSTWMVTPPTDAKRRLAADYPGRRRGAPLGRGSFTSMSEGEDDDGSGTVGDAGLAGSSANVVDDVDVSVRLVVARRRVHWLRIVLGRAASCCSVCCGSVVRPETWRWPTLRVSIATLLTGAAVGFLLGLVGIPGLPLMVLMAALQLDKAVMRATVSAMLATVHPVQVGYLIYRSPNVWNRHLAVSYGICTGASLVGLFVGFALFKKLSNVVSRRIVLVLLVISAALLGADRKTILIGAALAAQALFVVCAWVVVVCLGCCRKRDAGLLAAVAGSSRPSSSRPRKRPPPRQHSGSSTTSRHSRQVEEGRSHADLLRDASRWSERLSTTSLGSSAAAATAAHDDVGSQSQVHGESRSDA